MSDGHLEPTVSPGCATLFGKLPLKRDFVRIHHDYPEALAFDTWLQASLADLVQNGLAFGGLRARFLFGLPLRSLLGVLGPSRDRAGRAFPVSVFAPVPSALVTQGADALWLASEPFFAEAEAVLVSAQGPATLSDVEERVRHLEPPSPADIEAGRRAQCPALARAEAETEAMAASVAGAGAVDARPMRACDGGESRWWLGCPVDSSAQACLGCARTQAVGRRGERVSVLWAPPVGREPGRLLTCLGPVPVSGVRLLRGKGAYPSI